MAVAKKSTIKTKTEKIPTKPAKKETPKTKAPTKSKASTTKKEDRSCKSCRFYVHIKKTVEGKEVLEPTCCFHWPMSNTKDMEKECSLYIKWEGSLHGCK